MSAAAFLAAGLEIARIGVDLLEKRTDAATAARTVAGHAVKLIPVDELRAYLADEDKRVIDAAADIAEELKLKGETP